MGCDGQGRGSDTTRNHKCGHMSSSFSSCTPTAWCHSIVMYMAKMWVKVRAGAQSRLRRIVYFSVCGCVINLEASPVLGPARYSLFRGVSHFPGVSAQFSLALKPQTIANRRPLPRSPPLIHPPRCVPDAKPTLSALPAAPSHSQHPGGGPEQRGNRALLRTAPSPVMEEARTDLGSLM
ncbi:hypothetical protein DPEC_G00262990 [Dallia pectoralis]|uniref:Uncharacterized protein n=1 Tax=Dallia pectoralis TaxID=75939 RepID=A0ACC2FS49_DALPE|nr:hypothetical protein DPEC_G00262990 [Dallia pectoralis]